MIQDPVEVAVSPVSKSELAKASSAKSRINVPFSLAHWKGMDEDHVDQLAWFHQHALESDMNWKQCEQALNYSQTTIWRALKGEYTGDLTKVIDASRRPNPTWFIVCTVLAFLVAWQSYQMVTTIPPLTLSERKMMNDRINRLETDLEISKRGRIKDLEIMRDIAGYLKRLQIAPKDINPKLKEK